MKYSVMMIFGLILIGNALAHQLAAIDPVPEFKALEVLPEQVKQGRDPFYRSETYAKDIQGDDGFMLNKQKQTLTVKLQHVEVQVALQRLADIANLNLAISDDVKGYISLHLHDVTASQALAIILQTSRLASQMHHDIIYVEPMSVYEKQNQQALAAKQKSQALIPLKSALIRIKYGKAKEIATLLKDKDHSLLSKRGSVGVDERTNSLWVLDTQSKINDVKSLVNRLDTPVKQVLIEARIVNIDKSYEHELGIRWGVSHKKNLSGTLQGANQLQAGESATQVNMADRLNVDLPVVNVGTIGGPVSMGLALAQLGHGILLDLELSALESEGDAKIIASPRLMTANRKQAQIEAGEEIPYQQATRSGATSVQFKKAVLSLKVIPQITPDNRIILELKVHQDKRGPQVLQGVPTIDTRQIETQVLVNNGQTIVLGGIFQQTNNHNVERVPFLGSLPLVGHLFRHTLKQRERRELLIFVTPKIIDQANYHHE